MSASVSAKKSKLKVKTICCWCPPKVYPLKPSRYKYMCSKSIEKVGERNLQTPRRPTGPNGVRQTNCPWNLEIKSCSCLISQQMILWKCHWWILKWKNLGNPALRPLVQNFLVEFSQWKLARNIGLGWFSGEHNKTYTSFSFCVRQIKVQHSAHTSHTASSKKIGVLQRIFSLK